MGEHVKHVPIKEKKGGEQDYLYVDDIRGLLACVQMGTIEFHGWGSRADKVEYPDRLVFDLDPDDGLDFGAVSDAARRLRELLADLGLETFPLLTGGKGMHVVVPLDASRRLARGQQLRRALLPRRRRGRARALHRQHAQGAAQGPDLPRLAAQPARRDRGPALFRPRPRRRAGRGADRVGRARRVSKAATPSPSATPTCCSNAPSSKLLAGWGKAKQALPAA